MAGETRGKFLASRRHTNRRSGVHDVVFGQLPGFFKNEAELRAIWSAPDRR
jgi:hypothetical protein